MPRMGKPFDEVFKVCNALQVAKALNLKPLEAWKRKKSTKKWSIGGVLLFLKRTVVLRGGNWRRRAWRLCVKPPIRIARWSV